MAPELTGKILSSGKAYAYQANSRAQVGEDPFKVDVFSLGILAYIAFVKISPFESNAEILANSWDHCTSAAWDQVPDAAKELVCKMLEHNPEDRYSIDQVLGDPWLQAHARV